MMSLLDKFAAALDGLGSFQNDRRSLKVEDAGQQLTCELEALDTLACSLCRLSVSTSALADAPVEKLRTVGQSLAEQLTYLLEAIQPIEVDSDRCVVQLRSNPPHKAEDQTSYYELLVRRGGEVSLCRFAKEVGEARREIPAQTTREVLLRLAGDLSAAVR
jgi:hypothetical protein